MQNKILVVLSIFFTLICSDVMGMELYLLKPKDIPVLMKQCSRSAPNTLSQGWLPNKKIINNMRHDLVRSLYLKDKRLRNIEQYNFQFIGIYVKGERVIYLNGVTVHVWNELIESKEVVQNEPIVACGGGNAFIGVIYKPAEKKFYQLTINGPR